MRTEVTSGLQLGDRIKALYITTEGMLNAGITLESETLDLQQLQQQNMRTMNNQYGNNGRGGG